MHGASGVSEPVARIQATRRDLAQPINLKEENRIHERVPWGDLFNARVGIQAGEGREA
jgi:hypothetical protein